MPEKIPTTLAIETRSGVAIVPAMIRGAASTATGSRPSECRASICSETCIVPISAVIRAPTRPMRTKDVITGPSSRTTLDATTLPRT